MHCSCWRHQARPNWSCKSTSNLGKVALGQHAVASADAFANQRFDAVVSYINPGVDITRASVEVKLVVKQPPDYLRQDMTVSVDIESARRNQVLVLPVRDVYDVLSGAPWVMGVRAGRATKQPVELGIRGDGEVEILSGVSEGDLAIPVTANQLTGQRLRPIAP